VTLARTKIGELMMRLERPSTLSKKGAYGRVEEAQVMRTIISPGTGAVAKRGPKTAVNDAEIVVAILAVVVATPFHGEGYRKVRARLAHRGLAVGGKRVLRLMRAHQLLAPRRLGPPNGDPAHAGTITTTPPDEMWGTDATRFDRIIDEFIARYNTEWLIDKLGYQTPVAALATAIAA
jgi:putative transposase